MNIHYKSDSYEIFIKSHKRIGDLIGFAERENKKRSYLFVSKVLGKHYPSSPSAMGKIFKQLSRLVIKSDLNENDDNHLVIGMGETATGLGWGFFENLRVNKKLFIHTTRIKMKKKVFIKFKEAHSHDTDHYIYYPIKPDFIEFIKLAKFIYIVDDEITTGNTINNLSKAILMKIPDCKIIPISIVQWNSNFSKINSFSLLNAQFRVTTILNKPIYRLSSNAIKIIESKCTSLVVNSYGRFGGDHFTLPLEILPKGFKNWGNKKILILGSGEFNYIAYKFATLLSNSNDVYVQATTRSPIKIGGLIKSKIKFMDNYDHLKSAYLYNVIDKHYDIIVLFAETCKGSFDKKLLVELKNCCTKFYILYV